MSMDRHSLPSDVASRLRRLFRRPRSLIGWLFVLWCLLVVIGVLLSFMIGRLVTPTSHHWNPLSTMLDQATTLLIWGGAIIFFLLDFWRKPLQDQVWATLILLAILALVVFINYLPFFFGETIAGVENGLPTGDPGFVILMALCGLNGLLIAVRLIRRGRRLSR